MGKPSANSKPPAGSLAAFACKPEHAGRSPEEISQLAVAAGFNDASPRRIYHARWYYGLIPKRQKVEVLKPLVIANGDTNAEIMSVVLKHGTAAVRAVVDAIDQRMAAPRALPTVTATNKKESA